VRKGDLRIRNAHLVEDLVVLTRIRSLPLLVWSGGLASKQTFRTT